MPGQECARAIVMTGLSDFGSPTPGSGAIHQPSTRGGSDYAQVSRHGATMAPLISRRPMANSDPLPTQGDVHAGIPAELVAAGFEDPAEIGRGGVGWVGVWGMRRRWGGAGLGWYAAARSAHWIAPSR